MKVFLTGGTGFIGSHVAVELLRRKHQVRILARNPDKIPALAAIPGVEMFRGTMGDADVLRRGLAGADACVHIALNYVESRGSATVLDDTAQTVALAQAAVDAGVGRFVYTSSTSVHDELYDGSSRAPDLRVMVDPSMAPLPATFYGATKAACEQYLRAFSFQSSMRVNVIRPGYTFGNPVLEGDPAQADQRFATLAEDVVAGRKIRLDCNNGTQFIWAGHLACLYASLMESDFNRKTYYGLSAPFITWASLTRRMIEKTGSSSELIEEGLRSTGGLFWDVSPMRTDFGLDFDPWPQLDSHLDYWISRALRNG